MRTASLKEHCITEMHMVGLLQRSELKTGSVTEQNFIVATGILKSGKQRPACGPHKQGESNNHSEQHDQSAAWHVEV